jgi:predicted nucleic acid-binding protein
VILADTLIWVDYLHRGDAVMAGLLGRERVLMHPFVAGELALGHLSPRATILAGLPDLPAALAAFVDEVAALIERERLYGLGIGYVDVHLLAAVRLTPHTRLWTRDKRLAALDQRLIAAAALP